MLFDVLNRIDAGPATYSEPVFGYLNRSARPSIERARQTLETWFEVYPSTAKPDLLGRFRSPDRRQHLGAVFELYCHRLLRGNEFTATTTPQVTKDRVVAPDFIAAVGSGEELCFEATLVAEPEDKVKNNTLLNHLRDELDKTDSPNFFLYMTIDKYPTRVFRTVRLRRYLEVQLGKLDPTDVFSTSKGRMALYPEWLWSEADGNFRFKAIPKKPEARGTIGKRPIVGLTHPAEFVNSRKPLLK